MQGRSIYFSLRGLSGIILGIYGLLLVYMVHMLTDTYGDGFDGSSQLPIALLEIVLLILIVFAIIISLVTIWYRGKRNAKKYDDKLWNPVSRKLRFQALILLLLFTIILVIIVNMGYYNRITPLSLFLYGIFLLNIGRFSGANLKYLALAVIILAVVAYFIYDKEVLFLGLGFGIFHIVYGILTINKNRKVT